MIVISGKYKGKKINGFDIIGTRPTMDRVKESMFASIQNKIKKSIVLDLFAGSGQLGIEALSNGAKFVYFFDKSDTCINVIKSNLKSLNDSNNLVMKDDYQKALLYLKDKVKFDIIILDPPYNDFLINDVLDSIFKYDLLNDDGIIVCEYEKELVFTDKFNIIKQKKYGKKYVTIYKK